MREGNWNPELLQYIIFSIKHHKTGKGTTKCGPYSEKRESIAIGSGYPQILDIADKAFKTAIVNKFK